MKKKLLEQRRQLVEENRKLIDKAEAENRAMTAEENQQYEARDKEIDGLGTRIERIDKQEETEKRMAEAQPRQGGDPAPGTEPKAEVRTDLTEEQRRYWGARATEQYRSEFRNYLRSGMVGGEIRKVAETRDGLTADTPAAGGYILTPQQFVAELLKGVDNEVFVRRSARIFPLGSAESLGVPSLDSDVDDADWTPEITAVSASTGPTFGRRELKPNQIAKLVKVSNRLIRQAAINPEGLVRDRMAYKFGVTLEKAYLSGTGAGQPLGVFTASPQGISTGRDVVATTTQVISADKLIDAKYTMKAAYWPNLRWLFHRDAIKQIRKLKFAIGADTVGYMWEPSLQGGQPDRILDLPFDVSEYCPNTFTTGNYIGMLADWRYYWIADSLNLDVQRLQELYAATNQVGFIGRLETDGMPVLEEAFVRLKVD